MRAEVDERADSEAIELQLSEPHLVRFPTHGAECATDAERAASVRSACPECDRADRHAFDCVLRPLPVPVPYEDWLADRYTRMDMTVYRIAGQFIAFDEPIEPHQ
jgi:hypothetical protein